jgi:hypothetical protein
MANMNARSVIGIWKVYWGADEKTIAHILSSKEDECGNRKGGQ